MTGVDQTTLQTGSRFTNNSWGDKVRRLVQVTRRLRDSEWDQIEMDCYRNLGHHAQLHQDQGVESDNEEGHQVAKWQRKQCG